MSSQSSQRLNLAGGLPSPPMPSSSRRSAAAPVLASPAHPGATFTVPVLRASKKNEPGGKPFPPDDAKVLARVVELANGAMGVTATAAAAPGAGEHLPAIFEINGHDRACVLVALGAPHTAMSYFLHMLRPSAEPAEGQSWTDLSAANGDELFNGSTAPDVIDMGVHSLAQAAVMLLARVGANPANAGAPVNALFYFLSAHASPLIHPLAAQHLVSEAPGALIHTAARGGTAVAGGGACPLDSLNDPVPAAEWFQFHSSTDTSIRAWFGQTNQRHPVHGSLNSSDGSADRLLFKALERGSSTADQIKELSAGCRDHRDHETMIAGSRDDPFVTPDVAKVAASDWSHAAIRMKGAKQNSPSNVAPIQCCSGRALLDARTVQKLRTADQKRVEGHPLNGRTAYSGASPNELTRHESSSGNGRMMGSPLDPAATLQDRLRANAVDPVANQLAFCGGATPGTPAYSAGSNLGSAAPSTAPTGPRSQKKESKSVIIAKYGQRHRAAAQATDGTARPVSVGFTQFAPASDPYLAAALIAYDQLTGCGTGGPDQRYIDSARVAAVCPKEYGRLSPLSGKGPTCEPVGYCWTCGFVGYDSRHRNSCVTWSAYVHLMKGVYGERAVVQQFTGGLVSAEQTVAEAVAANLPGDDRDFVAQRQRSADKALRRVKGRKRKAPDGPSIDRPKKTTSR